MSGNIWVLVADAANAKIYNAYKLKLFQPEASENDLQLIQHLEHPDSKKHDEDLVSDNLGRFRSAGYGSDTFDPPTDPKKNEENRFALQLIKILDAAYKEGKFEELILVAPPTFMGMLNKHISKSNGLKKSIAFTIEKDYITLNERELVRHLQSYL